MAVPIRVPDLGPTAARLGVWLVGPGERVFEGDRVVEVVVPGATVDIPAPATGVVGDRLARPDDPVAAGQVVGTVYADG